MNIAIGIFFLAILAGAIFLFLLVAAYFLWRRSKRRAAERPPGFSSTRSQFVENDSMDDFDGATDDFAFAEDADRSGYSGNHSFGETQSPGAAAALRFEGASEGGGFVSSGSDYSESSATSYDSSSSSDSSSSGDSGSSSGWD